MILEQNVSVKVDSRTKEHYISKGVDVPEKGYFCCSVFDLHDKSNCTVDVMCDYCKETYSREYRKILDSRKKLNKDCCFKCRHLKEKEIDELGIIRVNHENKNYRTIKNTIYRYKSKYGIELNDEDMFDTYDCIQWWKWTYYNTPNGSRMTKIPKHVLNEDNVKNIFIYVVENELGYDTREKILNISFNDLIKYKINFKHFNKGDSLIDLLNKYFPEYNINPFELKNLPLNYMKNIDNVDCMMEYYLKIVINDITDIKSELPKFFTFSFLREFGTIGSRLCNAITTYNHYNTFFEWINKLHPEFELTDDDFGCHIAFDGAKLNSHEELVIYEYLKKVKKENVIPVGVLKNTEYKLYDKENDKYYIPDFIIKRDDRKIIVEYFGLYRDNYGNSKILKDYFHKTKMKIKFYDSLKEYGFIALYKDDYNNIISNGQLKGGEVIESRDKISS